MTNNTVRITQICIENFKNVTMGQLNLENNRKNYKASILGLYGQNGSGKTALIDAIQLLKHALMGHEIPAAFAEYIHVDAPSAHLQYTFHVKMEERLYHLQYDFSIRKVPNASVQNLDHESPATETYKVEIFDEVLRSSYTGEGKSSRMTPMIDTRTDGIFLPRSKYQLLLRNDKKTFMNLLVTKKLTRASSRSFIFSRELLNAIRERAAADTSIEAKTYTDLLEILVDFGNLELFVINTKNSGLINLNLQPLAFKYESSRGNAVGMIALRLDRADTIPQDAVNVVNAVVNSMNIVLQQIVPGLTIRVRELGAQLLPNGSGGMQIQLVSCKNSRELPLCYESDGIKKIISILHLLITLYNQSSITVAIDEMDSGIFEYLLGELLRIIAEKGKGQLIFTSHNLRPLETLDKGFIAFTTTNPKKRYIRLSNVRETNNLRDFYFRDIMLGEQREEVYSPTNNAEIALAFREAAEVHGA